MKRILIIALLFAACNTSKSKEDLQLELSNVKSEKQVTQGAIFMWEDAVSDAKDYTDKAKYATQVDSLKQRLQDLDAQQKEIEKQLAE